jgi:putative transposase
MPNGLCEPAVSRDDAQPTRGIRLHLCLDLARVCVCGLVMDTFANKIVGWRASRSQQTQFVLDALEQALYERRPSDSLIHHSDRGSQYVSIKYTERLANAGLEPSVGTVGDSYDNALAETMIGLFKAEVIHRLETWKSSDAVEWETLKSVDWFNNRRLLEPIG